jgi:hypothetical protein
VSDLATYRDRLRALLEEAGPDHVAVVAFDPERAGFVALPFEDIEALRLLVPTASDDDLLEAMEPGRVVLLDDDGEKLTLRVVRIDLGWLAAA